MQYSDRLKDPRWQKKRLEIFEMDNWFCQYCWQKDATLIVHHLYYLPVEPWEYPNEALITLCEDCHTFLHSPLTDDEIKLFLDYLAVYNRAKSQLTSYEKQIGAIYNPRLSRDIDASLKLLEAIL